MGRPRYTGWLAAFCAALINPAILVYGLPFAIGAGVDRRRSSIWG